MTTKHTPGPWVAQEQCPVSNWVDIRVKSSNGWSLPFAACKHFNEVANARLIAAAPDLLAALRAAYSDIQRCPGHTIDMLGRIEAAIAKATGDAPC